MGLSALLLALAITHARVDSAATVHILADTTSVIVHVTVPSAPSLVGTAVLGTITAAGDGGTLWAGTIGTFAAGNNGAAILRGRVAGLHPKRWSPRTPELYHLTLRAGSGSNGLERRVRFGFRSVSAENGRILLNGKPIFLRGNAINPPERNIPDSLEENRAFVEAYVRYLKSVNVNIIRLLRHSQIWFDVCDELGMMLFQGNYGTPRGGKPTQAPAVPLTESVAWYKGEVLGPLVNHPSVVVYVLSNEQADREIHYLSSGADGINSFLIQMYDSLRAWDPTRLYIANAGYGFGRAGDICDLHRYWGWYYNSFLSFYTMRDPKVCWRTDKIQPMTMTENVGNYTGVTGAFNLVSNTKQPDSQLNWTGHAPESEQAPRALAYQAWMAGQAIEIYRRSREQNPNLAGITPFTIIFHNWGGIRGFDDMRPKPVARQYGVSFQPVLLSWELWTLQVYAGSTIRPVAHVVNDSDDGRDLVDVTLQYSLIDASGENRLRGAISLGNVSYYAARGTRVEVQLPADLPTGEYDLRGTLLSGRDTMSVNTVRIFVAARSSIPEVGRLTRRVKVYDRTGRTLRALRANRVTATSVSSLERLVASRDLLVIGADAWDGDITQAGPRLNRFIADGGRVLILEQQPTQFDGSWLPAPVRMARGALDHSLVMPGGRPFREGMAVNPERPAHPILTGIDRDRLFLWSDFTDWDESKPGFPQVYPVTRGFALADPGKLERVAVVANYDHGLEGLAIAELFEGRGSVVMTGLEIVNRVGLDPVADRLLRNLVRYMGSDMEHVNALLFESKIIWGDYASERGLLTGIHSGLILNTVPAVPADLAERYPITVNENGFVYAGGSGGWNTKPAVQYFGKGRRPFGPYAFSYGGSVVFPDSVAPYGEGRVWLRVPSSRRAMTTVVNNPVNVTLDFEIMVNGTRQSVKLPPNQTLRLETPVRGGDTPLAIVFRGDRRAVLLETDFQ